MISMQPVIGHGFTFWDRALFPPDEFAERLSAVKSWMRDAELAALIVWSDAYHPSADLAYVAGWPMGGALLIRRDGEPTMLTSDNGRGAYFQRWLTWIDDVRPAGGRLAPALLECLTHDGLTTGAIGVVGAQKLNAAAFAQAHSAFGSYDLREIDAEFAALRQIKRPREIIAIRTALAIAAQGAEAAQRAFHSGAPNASALLAAERVARGARARDFRGLVNLAGPDLRPYAELSTIRFPHLLLWTGVDFHGYWAETASTSPDAETQEAQSALAAMINAARPGARAHTIAEQALRLLTPESADMALSYGLGHGVGLSSEEAPFIRLSSDERLREGMVLALRVYARAGATAALVGAMVWINADGAKRLTPFARQ